MAKDGQDGPPSRSRGNEWRQLDPLDKFSVLLNHFGNADDLAAATGLSAKSLRSVFTVIRQGKHSQKIISAEYKAAFRHARHIMTDRLRRRVIAASRGEYEAPILRTPTNVLQPQRQLLHITEKDTKGRVKVRVENSRWISYFVEHLPEVEIFNIARNLFETFMDTGQFNVFRFDFIAEAEIYSDSRPFRDEGLYQQAKDNDVIKISSQIIPFIEMRGNADYFEDYIRNEWKIYKAKGGVRLVELYFTDMEDLRPVMQRVKKDYDKLKKQKAKRNGKRKGKGSGFA